MEKRDAYSVLLVEDDPRLQSMLEKYLALFFEDVFVTDNTFDAYRIYEQKSPDVIYTDIELPRQNGLEFIQKIRQKESTTPIVILSAHTKNEYFTTAVELSLTAYLIKPISSQKLKESVEKCKKKLEPTPSIKTTSEYSWSSSTASLSKEGQEIELTKYELALLEILCKNEGSCVSYEDIHNHIYDFEEFSKSALSSLVKRVRQKTSKELIVSCFNFGYKIKNVLKI